MLNVFLAYRKNPSIALRNRLVELNINLARKIVHAISKTTTVEYEDLEQVAMLGLIAAVEKYDPDQGHKFSSYAVPLIQGKVLQYLRDKGTTIRIPQSLQDLYVRKIKTEDRLRKELGRSATTAEIIDALGVTKYRYQKILLAGKNKYPTSLSTPLGEDESATLEDLLVAPFRDTYAHSCAGEMDRALLKPEDVRRALVEVVGVRG